MAILVGFMFWWLAAGALPPTMLIICSVGVSVLWLCFTRHTHSPAQIDVLARKSGLLHIHPALKAGISLTMLVLCVAAQAFWAPCLLAIILMVVIVWRGKVSLHQYMQLLRLPMTFLLLSGIVLLWGWTDQPTAILSLNIGHGYLSISPQSQQTARLVFGRALGAVSCLYFLSLSTPMPELITVLRRCKVPWVLTDLAILMYRYVFILLDTHRHMMQAAQSRLGFCGLKRSLTTTGKLYGLLLANSFRKANQCFDAMESRCYDQDIRFDAPDRQICPKDIAQMGGLCLISALLTAATFR